MTSSLPFGARPPASAAIPGSCNLLCYIRTRLRLALSRAANARVGAGHCNLLCYFNSAFRGVSEEGVR